MTEEEKKTVEFLKEIVIEFDKCNSEYVIDKYDEYGFLNGFRVVLNLIEKLQKEIKLNEKLVDQLSYDMLKYFNYYNCKNNREIVEIYKRRILECDTNE